MRRFYLVLSCGLVLLLAAGCFQTAGESLDGTSVAQDFLTPTPSETFEPVVIDTEEATEAVLPEIPVQVTQEPPTEEVTEEAPVGFATSTPMGFATPTADVNLSLPEQDVVDDFGMTATAIILQATADSLMLTQAAEPPTPPPPDQGGGIEQPSPTPFIPPPLEFSPTPFQPPAATAALPPNFVQGQDCIHEVRVGDNLFRISLYYGLPISDIAAANGIANIHVIVVRQQLRIPGCGTTGNPPPPTSVPGTNPPYPYPTYAYPYPNCPGGQGGGRVHVVQQYETLFRLSLCYGVSVHAIAAANAIPNINLIYIGQQLIIP